MARSVILVNGDVGFGNSVTVRGGHPLRWDRGRAMQAIGPDLWRLEVDHDHPFEFKPLLNDERWAIGANAQLRPGAVRHLYPAFHETPGWVTVIPDSPRFFGHRHAVRVYHPPGYGQNETKRYPVLYCTDGQNLFEPAGWRQEWRLDERATELILAGWIEPLIIVGVDFRSRFWELGPWRDDRMRDGGGAGHFAAYLVHEVKAMIDARYPTLRGNESTGLMGSSMGGLFALWTSRAYPHVYARVAALSPSFHWSARKMRGEIASSQAHEPQKIYLDVGTNELPDNEQSAITMNDVWQVADELMADGWDPRNGDLMVHVEPGATHSEADWARRLQYPLRFLFGA